MEKRGEGADEMKVSDRRRFDSEGHERPDAPPKEPKEEPKEEARSLPPMDFSTFMLSLATSAQVHLGVVPNPATGKQERRLPLAKETIDLIGLLKEKTQGNLSDEEARLIERALYDLRMMYVEMSEKGEHDERRKA